MTSRWDVEHSDRFDSWWRGLDTSAQDAVARVVGLLAIDGPQLGFPYSSAVRSSQLKHLRELRVQSRGRPLRILYAFDPRRTAILLLGGDKTGDARWYERSIPLAEGLYHDHMRELLEGGAIDG